MNYNLDSSCHLLLYPQYRNISHLMYTKSLCSMNRCKLILHKSTLMRRTHIYHYLHNIRFMGHNRRFHWNWVMHKEGTSYIQYLSFHKCFTSSLKETTLQWNFLKYRLNNQQGISSLNLPKLSKLKMLGRFRLKFIGSSCSCL